MHTTQSTVPIIDVSALTNPTRSQTSVAREIDTACRHAGFFYIVEHGVGAHLIDRLVSLSQSFFALPHEAKMEIAMAKAGRAWRGYFHVGQELTSGKPDQKEGIYFGQELPADHPLVTAGTPLHGANLFPSQPQEFREVVLEYMQAMTDLGHRLMSAIALSLGIQPDYFEHHGVSDPLTLFRIFNYPPTVGDELWGVGEHTDYGLLTILLQDDVGGLEVKTGTGWVSAPPIKGSFVCNIGDMLDRMTHGVYRSTPHRVRNNSSRQRLSFPFFYDPNFQAHVKAIDLPHGEKATDDQATRWDGGSVHMFDGTYGEYLLAKVGKVFPELKGKHL